MRRRRASGFTLVELLLYLGISGIVIAAVLPVFVAQSKAYTDSGTVLDVRETLRGTSAALGFELRHVSAEDGDLIAIASDSVVFRSFEAFGVICATDASEDSYGLWDVTGSMAEDDSALVFVPGTAGPQDDTWMLVELDQVETPPDLGISNCSWPLATPEAAGLAVEVDPYIPQATAGAGLRTFVSVVYGTYPEDGKVWIGRRLAGNSTWERLAGPVLASGSGLEFVYRDAAGAAVAPGAETQVREIEITIRAQSEEPTRQLGDAVPAPRTDSLNVRIHLRG